MSHLSWKIGDVRITRFSERETLTKLPHAPVISCAMQMVAASRQRRVRRPEGVVLRSH